MLKELFIKNFAIIDELRISFSSGLNIMTGETGAGKSIIVNAVNLLLGARASADLIRQGADSAELEAYFEIPPDNPAGSHLKDQGYDTTDGLIIKRIISRNNRHRLYLNGRLATLQMLTPFTENLVCISGQHAHQQLLRAETHLDFLDRYSALMGMRQEVESDYLKLLPMRRELERLKSEKRDKKEKLELYEFQRAEIDGAGLKPNEDQELETERSRLRHAERLSKAVYESIEGLYESGESAYAVLARVQESMKRAVSIDDTLSKEYKVIKEIMFSLEDLGRALSEYLGSIEMDPARLEMVEDRLDLINRIKKKYQGSIEDVLAYRETLEDAVLSVEATEEKIKSLKERISKAEDHLFKKAYDLSQRRRASSVKMGEKIEKALESLMMKGVRFEIKVTELKENSSVNTIRIKDRIVSPTGLDRVDFMIETNPGEGLKPLTAIASGGELSRAILAFKTELAQVDSAGTVIFDEVDAGIGGEAAELVGKRIKTLASLHQVICITHLPQIAKYADRHLKLEKYVENGRTKTSVRELDFKKRIQEIARMLAGTQVTETTIKHAEEMIVDAG